MLYRSKSGFTIVELLIVIVVIGILAAITTVAFNGIQSRSQNTSVQSDVRNNATRLNIFRAENDRPPTIAEISANQTVAPKFSSSGAFIKVASYCVADLQYAIGIESKNDQKYYSLNGGSLVNNNSVAMANICDSLGITKSGGSPADTTTLINNGTYVISTLCGGENDTCSFSGSRVIAYGANGTYFYQAATGSIQCTNVAFGGDPVPNVVKNCYLTN